MTHHGMKPQPAFHKRAFREREAALYVAMSTSFLRQDRMNGSRENRTPGPRWTKVGRTILYLKEDLDDWLDQHRVSGDAA